MAKSISGPDQLRALFQKKLWILDMDGTVYLGDRVFPETLPFLERVRAAGADYLFFTNNASRSKQTYVKRLRREPVYDRLAAVSLAERRALVEAMLAARTELTR